MSMLLIIAGFSISFIYLICLIAIMIKTKNVLIGFFIFWAVACMCMYGYSLWSYLNYG